MWKVEGAAIYCPLRGDDDIGVPSARRRLHVSMALHDFFRQQKSLTTDGSAYISGMQ